MIKWKAHIKEHETIGIGITSDDLITLLKRDILFIKAEEFNIPFDITIHHGQDYKELTDHLRSAGLNILNLEEFYPGD